jgi:hypothetical protein
LASFNIPEEISNQFISFWQLNQLFFREFKRYLFPGILLFGMFIVLIITKITRFLTNKHDTGRHASVFALSWFVVSLLPVLFYAHHYFPYYLPIPLVGILLFIVLELSIFFEEFFKNMYLRIGLLTALFGIWYWSSISTVNFNRLIHWAPRRALLTQELISKTIPTYQTTDSGIKFFVEGPEIVEKRLVLGNQNAFRVLYDNDAVVTEYEKADRLE